MKEQIKILRPNKLKTFILIIISTLFVIAGFIVMDEKIFIKWSVLIFFGIGIIVSLIKLLPNSAYLKLNNEGFEVCSLYRSHFTKWTDVNNFGIFTVRFNTMVVFNYIQNHNYHSTGNKIAKFLSKNEGGLPDNYGMKATELAELLNEWKHKSMIFPLKVI